MLVIHNIIPPYPTSYIQLLAYHLGLSGERPRESSRRDPCCKQQPHWLNICPRSTHNNRGNLLWHIHPARALLIADIAAGRHVGRTPLHLKSDRVEYKDFGTEQWCKIVHAEISRQRADVFGKQSKTEKRTSDTSNEVRIMSWLDYNCFLFKHHHLCLTYHTYKSLKIIMLKAVNSEPTLM